MFNTAVALKYVITKIQTEIRAGLLFEDQVFCQQEKTELFLHSIVF